jgi:dUTP pyrophosphatase
MYELSLPERATKGSAGYDIRTPFAFTLKPGHSLVVPTGIRCIMPEGFVLMLFPRSGLGFKYGICLENTTGIIDSDFINSESYGHILVKLHNPSDKIVYFNRNDKICQGIITKYFVTDDDNATAERLGGFGSTGQ